MKLSEQFKFKQDKSVVFIGKELEVIISKRFENYRLLSVKDTVTTLGIFELVMDGKKSGMLLPAVIEMCPSTSTTIINNGNECVSCIFKQGDVFIKNTNVVRNKHLAYVIFTEFVEKGKMPDFLKYADYAFIFDIIQDICGLKIPSNHVAFEIIYAFLSRKHDDYTKMYRFTDMKQPPLFLRLADSAHATSSVTAKLVGSYMSDAINAAIVNESENESKLEELLRQ